MSSLTVIDNPRFEITLDKSELEYLFALLYMCMANPRNAPLFELYETIEAALDIDAEVAEELKERFKEFISP